MRSTLHAVVGIGILAGCSYTDLDESNLRRPSSWASADAGKVAATSSFSQDAALCDEVSERLAAKRLPINDPGETGSVMRQRHYAKDLGFYRCMASLDWRPRPLADEAVGLKPASKPHAKVWNAKTQHWDDYNP